MGTFASVSKGRKARKPLPLPFLGDKDGKAVACDLVVLNGTYQTKVDQFAREHSLAHGGTGLPNDPIYERAQGAATLAYACLDPDEKEKEVFFFASPNEVLEEFGDSSIAFIYEHQRVHQREVAPGMPSENATQFMTLALTMAESGDIAPFVAQRQDSQWSYVLYTANLLSTLLTSKLRSISDSEHSGPSTKKTIQVDASPSRVGDE